MRVSTHLCTVRAPSCVALQLRSTHHQAADQFSKAPIMTNTRLWGAQRHTVSGPYSAQSMCALGTCEGRRDLDACVAAAHLQHHLAARSSSNRKACGCPAGSSMDMNQIARLPPREEKFEGCISMGQTGMIHSEPPDHRFRSLSLEGWLLSQL